MNIRHLPAFAAAAITALAFAPKADAHCQVPCGIYADNNVIDSMHTDWETIQKATQQIIELSKDSANNAHQLTRWIINKESHAQAMQDKVLNYFLAQRLKPDEADRDAYLAKLTLCHKIIVTAMKCKQGVDTKNVDLLHDLMHDFETAFGEKK